MSTGASRPFFVVAAGGREPMLKRPLALGADATRRMNRLADAPIARGESGPPMRGLLDDATPLGKFWCDALAGGCLCARPRSFCFSGLVPCRGLEESDASVDVCEECAGVMGVCCDLSLESLDWVFEELYENRWSIEPGVSDWFGVDGTVAGTKPVSNVSELPAPVTTNFLEDVFPTRKMDFHVG